MDSALAAAWAGIVLGLIGSLFAARQAGRAQRSAEAATARANEALEAIAAGIGRESAPWTIGLAQRGSYRVRRLGHGTAYSVVVDPDASFTITGNLQHGEVHEGGEFTITARRASNYSGPRSRACTITWVDADGEVRTFKTELPTNQGR